MESQDTGMAGGGICRMQRKVGKQKDYAMTVNFRKEMTSTVEEMPGKIDLEELQKIILMGTAHILRKVLSTDL